MIDIVSHYPGLIRSRLRLANVGRNLGLTLDHPVSVARLAQCDPPDGISLWVTRVSDGRIVRAQGEYLTCGKGLWLHGPNGPALGAAILQSLIVNEHIETGLFVRTEQYLQSERPEGDRQFRDRQECDVLVLAGYGTERRNESGWAEATLDNLIVTRYEQGLPTIVTSMRMPPTALSGYLCDELFYGVETIKESSANGKFRAKED